MYIVVLRDSADPLAVAREHASAHGLAVEHVYRHALKGYAATVPAGRLAHLAADPRVLFVSEDRPVWAFGEVPTGVKRIEADRSPTWAGGVSGVSVAIIDTGIDTDHPDLNVVGGINCQKGNSYEDGNGHGTHVAGTVGANGGVLGVAPGAPLYAVRVLNNAGSRSWASVICGVDWVTAQRGLDPTLLVANMSLGGSGSDGGPCATTTEALQKAICGSVAAGVTYVVAAGNSAADFKGFVPAAYDQVLTVTAMADFNGAPGGGAAATCRSDVDDTAADFSNFTTAGSADEGHTIAAPGVCILSTWKGGGYNTISGTSMASPHVAGTVALCIASGECTSPTPAEIMARLRQDAAGTSPGYGFTGDPDDPIISGGGRRRPPTTLYYGHLIYAGGY
jgi:subtilisin family serine protease